MPNQVSDAQRSKERREAARAEGLCHKCFKRIPMPNRPICGYCDEMAEEYKASRRRSKHVN